MKKFREESSRDQLFFLPPSINEYVSETDGVRYVDSFVEELDFSDIEGVYLGGGRPAYRPRTLVKILIYGTMRGVRSSRELAMLCRENLRFIYLARNERPDFRTISDFRKRFLEELGGILKQTVRIGIEEGFIELNQVAIDGTKVRANAGRRSFKDPKNLEELLAALEVSLKEGAVLDEEEDEKHGDDDGDFKLPDTVRERQALKKKIQAAIKSYGEIDKATKPKHVSTTDPEARFMEGQEGNLPSYNAQASVDTDSHLIVGAYVTNDATDREQLVANIQAVEEVTEKKPSSISADKGYLSRESVDAVDEDIGLFIPSRKPESGRFSQKDFAYDEKNDEYTCPAGQILEFKSENYKLNEDIYQSLDCSDCFYSRQCLKNREDVQSKRVLRIPHESEAWANLQKRMDSEEGKKAMTLRAQTVELVFAWMKTQRKLRRFIFRGLNQVTNQWRFEAAVSNIVRLTSLRLQKQMSVA